MPNDSCGIFLNIMRILGRFKPIKSNLSEKKTRNNKRYTLTR